DMILIAQRDAARRDDQLVIIRRRRERCCNLLLTIGQNTEIADLAPPGLQGGKQHVAVAVMESAGFRRLRRLKEFVPRREKGDAKATKDLYFRDSDRGEITDILRAQSVAAHKEQLAFPDILSGKPAVLALR